MAAPEYGAAGGFLENGHNSAGIGVVDVILYFLAGQRLDQSLGLLGLLVAFLHYQNVGVGPETEAASSAAMASVDAFRPAFRA